MKHGVYQGENGLSFEEYLCIPAINSSTLKHGEVSMRHMKAAVDGEIESDDSRDKRFGSSVHCRLLEPERYAREAKIATGCCATKKSGERCTHEGRYELDGIWFCGTHRPDEAVEPHDYITKADSDHIERMAESLKHHEAMEWFRASGWFEATVIWECMGLLCKSRLDKYTPAANRILDLKKGQVEGIDTESCERSIINYQWHKQAAYYVDSIVASGRPEPDFFWVFIEEKPPYEINIIQASQEVLDIGRFEYRTILDNWKRSQLQGKYHGYVYSLKSIRPGGLPGWYLKQFEGLDTANSFPNALTIQGREPAFDFGNDEPADAVDPPEQRTDAVTATPVTVDPIDDEIPF